MRDRKGRLIWLSQVDYIDKIAVLSQSKTTSEPSTPMATEELLPWDQQASPASLTRLYQRKIGSILYAAVITRPDITFAVSRLARFNGNPSPQHHAAADRVLNYLKATATMALEMGGEEGFETASDASFADNTLDRKSSQAYVMRLSGGTIGWRANKQATVTTSTTEAELLSLAQAAKEALFQRRLLEDLKIPLDRQVLLLCDNKQTIGLVNKEIALLNTRLRHVDIHNHWLRQEAAEGRIKVQYTPTGDMVADGLTKVLPAAMHRKFVAQLGLRDVRIQIRQRRFRELHGDILDYLEDQLL